MKSLLHPALRLLGIAAALAVALSVLFSYLAPWLWAKASPPDIHASTPWMPWAAVERDGIQPYALLLLVLGACAAAVVVSRLTERLPQRLRAVET